jgi:hypothetical protein
MISGDVLAALKPVVEIFEQLGIPYLIGGSIASSVYGVARSTLDADVMADVKAEHVASIISLLSTDYYVSEVAIREALARRSSFNLVHLDTMVKVDVFIPKGEPFDQSTLLRHHSTVLDKSDPHSFQLTSPEDIILLKLDWFRQGGAESVKQWRDIIGVLRVQAEGIDRTYLSEWSTRLGLNELLDKALLDAGLTT